MQTICVAFYGTDAAVERLWKGTIFNVKTL
jgi:hypothetical protein